MLVSYEVLLHLEPLRSSNLNLSDFPDYLLEQERGFALEMAMLL